jgi:hypothetical protein
VLVDSLQTPHRILRRTTIFHDDADYRTYLSRLERYRHRDGVTVQVE